jgi:peptidoglycan/LPS O-acetylase OafA/YrhL
MLARGLNAQLHLPAMSAVGWSVQVGLRVLATAWMGWCMYRLPDEASGPPRSRRLGDSAPKTFDPLLGLRAMACLMVMLGHYFMVVFGVALHSRLAFIGMMPFLSSPWGGVWIFFTLSGYLMGKGFERKRYALDGTGLRRFYRNRVLRILPLYLAATVLFSVFLQPEVFLPKRLWELGQVLVFDYRAESGFTAVEPLWSVSTEMQFYILVPFLFCLAQWAQRRAPRVFWAGVLLLYPAMVVARYLVLAHTANFTSTVYCTFLFNADLFFVGMSLNLVRRPAYARGALRSGWGLLVAGAGIYTWCFLQATNFLKFHLSLNDYWVFGPALVGPAALAFIWIAETTSPIGYGKGWVRMWLRGVEWTGILAYPLYVFHSQVMISFRRLLPPDRLEYGRAFQFAPLCFFLIFLLSFAFYKLVEQPFERKKLVPDGPITDAP